MEDGRGQLARFAQPNDPDLDVNVAGTVISALVRCGNDILVEFAGGQRVPRTDTAPGRSIRGLRITACYADTPASSEALDLICARLEHWRANATPLRVCTAQGRIATVSEHPRCWVGLPGGPASPVSVHE